MKIRLLFLTLGATIFTVSASDILLADGHWGRSPAGAEVRPVVVNVQKLPQVLPRVMAAEDIPPFLSEVPIEELERLKEAPSIQKIKPRQTFQQNEDQDVERSPYDVMAPTLLTSFAGIQLFSSGMIPPDPVIAAGPNNLILVVNGRIRITDKKIGTTLSSSSLTTWFNSVWNQGTPFDPKVVYDQFSDRWIVLALARNTSSKISRYLLSVSQTGDPTGNWNFYALDAAMNGSNPTNRWADWTGLGYDRCAIYITSNQYKYSPQVFSYSKLRILNKSDAYNGSPLDWYDFWGYNNQGGTKVFGWKPAHMFEPPGGYLICGVYLVDTRPIANDFVQLWKVTNPLGSPPTLTRLNKIDIARYHSPPNAPQTGSTNNRTKINTGDCRIQDVQYRNGYLHTSFTEGYNWGQGKKAAIRYIRINAGGSGILVNDVRFGSSTRHYFYPNVYTDLADNIYLVFNRCFESEYANVRFTGKLPSETSFQTPSTLLKGGEAFYQILDGNNRNRWGDYSGICVDPEQQYTIWMVGEYAESPSSAWGTWVGLVRFSPPAKQPQADKRLQQASSFTLAQNYPNPFNASTWITYSIPQDETVRLVVYDMLGREVTTLVNEPQPTGTYEVYFDGSNVSSGMYYYRLTAGNHTTTKSFILLK